MPLLLLLHATGAERPINTQIARQEASPRPAATTASPIVHESGSPLADVKASFDLIGTKTFSTGVIIASYRPKAA